METIVDDVYHNVWREEGRKGEGVRSEQVGSESSRLRAGPHKMQLVLIFIGVAYRT